MIRGETITTTVTGFPVPVSEIATLQIIFWTPFATLLEKTLADCTIDGESVKFRLSQEESLSLRVGDICRTVIVVTKDGSRFESKPSAFKCGQTQKDEVL